MTFLIIRLKKYKMKQGLDFPILLNAPKEVPITLERFDKFSYIGLASFMISYPVIICKRKKKYELHICESNASELHEKEGFKDLKFWCNSEAEIVWCDIPFTHDTAKQIEKDFKHLIIN